MKNLPDLFSCKIAVVGLGYVGLPVAIQFAKQKKSLVDDIELDRKIIGYDINSDRINQLKNGIDLTNEIKKSEIVNLDNIFFTSDENQLDDAEVFIVTLPTPIDETKNPDLTIIKKACKTIGKAITNNKNFSKKVVIFESTVFPGATEEIFIPIIKKQIVSYSGNDKRNNFNEFVFGYSPERINPGDKLHNISSIVKITSGNNEEVTKWIDYLYGSVIEAGTFRTSNIKIAEAAKVIENTQRDLNIALINELSMIFKKMGIDTLDVIEAAKTKWNFIDFKPGLVGGHCIGVDPYYLTHKSEKVGYYPEIILAGRRINDSMASWYVDQLILRMAKLGIDFNHSKALILGFTFKENCPDIRNTKVIDIIGALKNFNIDCDVVDPHADKDDAQKIYEIKIYSETPKTTKYPIVIIAVAHNDFLKFDIEKWNSFTTEKSIFFDIKGILPRELNPERP